MVKYAVFTTNAVLFASLQDTFFISSSVIEVLPVNTGNNKLPSIFCHHLNMLKFFIIGHFQYSILHTYSSVCYHFGSISVHKTIGTKCHQSDNTQENKYAI